MYFYRPQRSCEGYVFTPVCLSTGGGLPQHMLGYPPGAGTPQSRHPPGTRHPQSRHPPGTKHPQEQAPPGADTPTGAGTSRTRPPPPSRQLRLRTVRILLECILVTWISCVELWLHRICSISFPQQEATSQTSMLQNCA